VLSDKGLLSQESNPCISVTYVQKRTFKDLI